jgi:integrase
MGTANKLSALKVARVTQTGMHGDGAGLWLRVSEGGAKSWIFRFMLAGRARSMGLGSYPDVSLEEARENSAAARRCLRAGIDPILQRDENRLSEHIRAAKSTTFQKCADDYIAAHRVAWKNLKHCDQWTNTIATYCGPIFGTLPVNEVDTALVMRALEPIWTTKTETATRLRGRIECILDWATVRGFRQGENPARWKGHLSSLLPKSNKIARTVHHAALPFKEIAAFLWTLREQDGTGARALEFAILTACRSGEVRGATWGEIDLIQRIWTIPADRMKAKREHRVPLSPAAMKLLRQMKIEHKGGDLVFSGRSAERPLSDMSLTAVLRRMKRGDLTVHGFRSTFRDWAAESTSYSRDVAEMALAHTVGDRVEAAYRRGDLFTKRGKMMNDWSRYCETTPSSKGVLTAA